MYRPFRTASLTVFSVFTLALAACASAPTAGPVSEAAEGCAGVQVVVDFATLGPQPIDTCVGASAETSAADIAKQAGLTTQGTGDYGDAIVCRVNGEPSAQTALQLASGSYTEDCADMPSADAYWSVWVKDAGVWDYAQVGFNDLKLKPGQSVALLFDINNSVTAPEM